MSQNLFSDELLSFIDEWKDRPGNLIMVLHRVQSEVGYISREAADEVSRLLDVPLSTIWGVVTFYHFFKLTKPGKYRTDRRRSLLAAGRTLRRLLRTGSGHDDRRRGLRQGLKGPDPGHPGQIQLMDALDFLFEAVKNSLEAGAGTVSVRVEMDDGQVHVTCTDDGAWEPDVDHFARGGSSKGDGRGQGLYLLARLDRDAALVRAGDRTVLTYSFPRRLMGDGSQVYPFLFSMCRSRGVHLVLDAGGRVLTDDDMVSMFGDLETAGGISGMKRFIASSIDSEQ